MFWPQTCVKPHVNNRITIHSHYSNHSESQQTFWKHFTGTLHRNRCERNNAFRCQCFQLSRWKMRDTNVDVGKRARLFDSLLGWMWSWTENIFRFTPCPGLCCDPHYGALQKWSSYKRETCSGDKPMIAEAGRWWPCLEPSYQHGNRGYSCSPTKALQNWQLMIERASMQSFQ